MTMAEDIFEVVKSFSPWIEGGPLPESVPFKRDVFGVVHSHLKANPKRKGLVILGPRQVGKSTLLKQLVSALGGDSSVLYVSMDHPRLRDVPMDIWVEPWLKLAGTKTERCTLLLDEAPFAKDWDTWMKYYLDHRKNVFIVATGSSSTSLRKGTKESGVGRWDEIWMPQFLFEEVLRWRAGTASPTSPWVLIPSKQEKIEPAITATLEEYLQRGGFPIMWETKDLQAGYEQLRRDAIERALFRDINLISPIRDVATLERVFYACAPETGRIISIQKLSDDIRRSQSMVDNYLKLISDCGLLHVLNPYPGLSRRGLGGIPKIVLADPALYHAAVRPLSITASPETEGQLLETIIAQHFATVARTKGGVLSYWRRGKEEADFVFELGGEAIPIGITRSTRVGEEDVAPLDAFLGAFPKKASTGLFLYRGPEKDITLKSGRGTVACRNIANYLFHLSRAAVPRFPES